MPIDILVCLGIKINCIPTIVITKLTSVHNAGEFITTFLDMFVYSYIFQDMMVCMDESRRMWA